MAKGNVNIDPRFLTFTRSEVDEILKNVETVEAAPTKGSDYPVSANGVYEAIHGDFFES